MVVQASGSLTKVFQLLDVPVKIASKPGAREFDEELREIACENVSFRYGENLSWSLRNVSLTIHSGTQTGIIGPSGSGKSTMMALLLRYYDPTEGRILVNGVDIRDWELISLRRAFGLVPQEIMLFSGTIRENVLYTHDKRSDAVIMEALERAEAAGFVKELEKGLDTEVGERGVSLSGGQKQRLAIARALLARPQALVLDNCTSALDGETEQKLLRTLREFMAGKTACIVSHRVASVAHCAQIVVMDAGRIVELGTADELMEAKGYYADIHAQQSVLLSG
jgi:ABC-type multidrug transport system fused ATPase/permease subunit